ncbi:MAG: HsdR family type I site-specific deoxyribonuclease [Acidobacteria bacterium]|nr:HsdR family type I site-specific deoxyribonuclease [Acidobacteriota bacterium]
MTDVGQLERRTQNRIVRLLRDDLGYNYLGNLEAEEDNRNINEEHLRAFLVRQGYDKSLIDRAIFQITSAAGNQAQGLYTVNKEVYSILRYAAKVKANVDDSTEDVWLIDWKSPLNNDFAIAEEVSIKRENKKRPDIVLYVNGIALCVIELKRSIVSVSEGIRQNLDNQTNRFIKPFFATMQLVMAGNDTQGLRYGTIETKEKYYLKWKEEGEAEPEEVTSELLDRQISQVCRKERFLEIIHDFIVFDRGIKKVCRPNQYFGMKAAQERIRTREGGIIWHTQGSGKSLTMVWLAKWIRENVDDSRVLIITDRDELDEQIEKVFKGVEEDIYRTKSGEDLVQNLNVKDKWLLGSLVHKFGRRSDDDEASDKDYQTFIENVINSLPDGYEAKGDIYVFIDECHRTQSGKLHKAMKTILPNALFIGFTGTPLLKQDRATSMETFGTYIHQYRYDQAVKDEVVLDLRYEARKVDQNLTNQEKIDQWFEAKTRELTDHAKNELKQKWGTMQNVLSSHERLEQIANDIIFDMETKDRLQNGRGNAMLVAGSIYEACKYYEIFQNKGFKKCAIVTSYNPTIDKAKDEATGEDAPTDNLKKLEVYEKMLNGKDVETFEKEVKDLFVDHPAQMKLLIVVDKLLTGFDAPSATYLYIDKSMRDHGLFQAICRVNRLDDEDKEYGYIIDYKDLFKSLQNAVDDYTSEAFDGYDAEDVQGLLTNRLKKAKETLDARLEAIRALCEPVDGKSQDAYVKFFCGSSDVEGELKQTEPRRTELYKITASMIRAYSNVIGEMPEAGYTNEEIAHIKKDVEHFKNVREEIKLASGDYIDLKAYEPAMRQLIDTYISADESEKISTFDDMSLVELIVERGRDAIESLPKGIRKNQEAVAETIENNLRRLIVSKQGIDPKYYKDMSELLDELIKFRKEAIAEYETYLTRFVELTKKVSNPESEALPASVKESAAMVSLFHNLNKDVELVERLHKQIQLNAEDGFRGDVLKERKLRIAIKSALREFGISDSDEIDKVFKIVSEQEEY